MDRILNQIFREKANRILLKFYILSSILILAIIGKFLPSNNL
jgi:hypothetical protein